MKFAFTLASTSHLTWLVLWFTPLRRELRKHICSRLIFAHAQLGVWIRCRRREGLTKHKNTGFLAFWRLCLLVCTPGSVKSHCLNSQSYKWRHCSLCICSIAFSFTCVWCMCSILQPNPTFPSLTPCSFFTSPTTFMLHFCIPLSCLDGIAHTLSLYLRTHSEPS